MMRYAARRGEEATGFPSKGSGRRFLGRLALPGACVLTAAFSALSAFGADLDEIKKRGELRHLGIPYANFVTGTGDGLDVELVQLFARHLGVRYRYVRTDWDRVITDLTGQQLSMAGGTPDVAGPAPVEGDIAATGMTVIPWRSRLVDFSRPLFPTQVWLIARADSPLAPIRPSGNVEGDIAAVRRILSGRSLLTKANTCLDPTLYALENTGASVLLFAGGLNELAPALISEQAELTILDVPDVLVALQKWPGKIKVIGPVSGTQHMAAAFRKDSPALRAAFNAFIDQAERDGTYLRLVRKYYPFVFEYYPAFFRDAGR